MALIALLSARDNARERTAVGHAGSLIEFGGQPLIEFQARMAINAGAEHVFIQVDSTSPDLSQLVDRLTADRQASIALVQDMATLSRSLVPDDRLIVIAENLIAPPEAMSSLTEGSMPAFLALPVVPATTGFERIDGETVWAGAMSVSGGAVLDTVDMLGEWDLGLTLLRRAVQDGARRILLSPELVMDGRLTLVHDQQSADAALQVLADQGQSTTSGQASGLGGLLAPVARPLVRELVRRQIEPVRASTIALVLSAAGLGLGVSGFAILAVLVMLSAQGLSDIARQSAEVTLRPAGSLWRNRLVPGLGLALLAVIGWRLSDGHILSLSGAWLPLLLTAMLSLVRERSDPVAELWADWLHLTVPIALLVILSGLVLDMTGVAFTLLGLIAAAIVAIRLFREGSRV
jgi:hypothetical protein